jgi:hypothetical protein
MRKPIIAGIDPGTTTAYAVFDTEGNLLKIASKRNASTGRIISELVDFGKVLIVSCDVSPAPKFAETIAKKTGAVLICPRKSLLMSKKARLVDEFLKEQREFIKISNKHERDAIASALYGYKSTRRIFDKIGEEIGRELSDSVKERVLKERF